MAKETMQAVSEAEKSARETILHAKEESERLAAEAQAKGGQLVSDAVKDARKKVEVLCGVARADAEKLAARTARETADEQERLRQSAESSRAKVVEEIQKIVLGQP